ncbi:MAG: AsmA-like C-terminal region-containing protein [Deltaproteobacteria bacterium]|nr:AsmA-like C-terminal region-containing protein [Deltaproteobacteria bacterium]
MGLIGDVAPFHLETDLRADLSQLPPILKRLVDDKDFQKELAQLTELKGSADGKLVLGENTENVKVKLEASNIQLSANYERLPHPLLITGGKFSYDEYRIGVRQLNGKLGKSSFSELTGSLGLDKKQDLAITSGKSNIFLAEIVPWFASFATMREISEYNSSGKSIITLSQVKMKGPLFSPAKWDFNVSGDVKDLVLKNIPGRPGPLKIASAKFKADPQTIEYTDGRISLLDGVWKISGAHSQYFKGFDKDVRLKFEARLGSKSVQWLSSVFDLPDEIKIRPLTLSTSHINYVRNGEKTISADLAIRDGLKISADLILGSDKLVVKKLFIQDKASRANIGISLNKKILSFSFKGNLQKSTLDRLITENPWLTGWLLGDFKAHIDTKQPLRSAAWGNLKGKEIIYPWKPDTPLKINDVAASATTHKINLKSADITFSGNRLKAAGNMTRSAQNLLFDMDISADSLDLDQLIHALTDNGDKARGEKAPNSQALPIQGNIRLRADRFNIGKFTWKPLHADISLKNDTADVTLKKAALCGISTPGTLKVSPSNIEFDIETDAKDQELVPTKTCLVGGTFKVDGTYNLKGRFQGSGKAEELLKTVTGQVDFTATDGHIYHDVVMLEVLKFLNTLEIFEGRANVKDMKKKGFDYRSFRIKAKLQDGKLRYDEAVLHGRPMTVTAAGNHNLQNGRLDLTLLVAPLVTLDLIFEHIPLIGGILEALDTIPLSAKGTLDNIHIRPLAPSAVGYELEEMMKKTVERPVNLVHGRQKTEAR